MNIQKISGTAKKTAVKAQKTAVKAMFFPIGISGNKAKLQENLRLIEQKNLIRDKILKTIKPITDFLNGKIFKI